MQSGSKILIGAAATALLAVVGHWTTGETFIAGLQQKAQTELAARGLETAQVSFAHSPLSRHAILDGELPDNLKQEAVDLVAATPGVSSARWKGEEAAPAAEVDEQPAATEAPDQSRIARCQTGVDKVLDAKHISFRSGSAYISLESKQILDEIAAALKPCDGLTVAVEGHTDDNGDSDVNRDISQERADRIKAGLVERGIPETLITATGYGSTRPLAKGSDAAADAQNRRIEFRIGSADGPVNGDVKAQRGK
ncbi:OmpA family protein [Parasphingorhabdus sp.]|uniref:OmpA family protein n=1 Tax=Parasphingorhabdus sp. TaxID=2709688 RepID=UPI003A94F666